MTTTPDCDVTFVLRTFDDEERVGHALRRAASWLSAHGLRSEILVADEGSGDNTLAVAVMLRPDIPNLTLIHADPGAGFRDACRRARGRIVVLADARTDAPLASIGYALGRLREGLDVVALGGRYLVFRRTHAWRAFEALGTRRRDPAAVARRFVRRARALGLACVVTHRPEKRRWSRLLASFRPFRTMEI